MGDGDTNKTGEATNRDGWAQGDPEDQEVVAEPGAETGPDLAAENAALKDKLLRALAETENVRRRAERDRSEAAQYGLANFARDILAVADNLRRALDHLPAEAREQADDRARSFVEGVEVTERELLNAMERHKIRAIDPQGERFDPHFHQAMFEVESPGVAPGTVVQVVQTGYAVGDRLLRPAMVGVAKAPARGNGSEQRLDTSA